MIPKKERKVTEINASSMADIAFLLLIFFLVTTTIASDKGINMKLPPNVIAPPIPSHKRNVLEIQINSENNLMIEGEEAFAIDVKKITREFLSNNGRDVHLSDNPNKAVVSIKGDRGTNYSKYIEILDAVKAAYFELRAESVEAPLGKYMKVINTRKGDRTQEEQQLFEQAKLNFPLQISEAEPTGK